MPSESCLLFPVNEDLDHVIVVMQSLTHVQLFETPWTAAHQASVHRIFQTRILEWVVISFFRGSSQPRDQIWVACIASRFFTG